MDLEPPSSLLYTRRFMIEHLGFAGKSRVSLKPKAAVTRQAVIRAPSETVGGAAEAVGGAGSTSFLIPIPG